MDMKSNFMFDYWLGRRAILKTKNVDIEEINAVVEVFVSGEMRAFTSLDTVDNENKTAQGT